MSAKHTFAIAPEVMDVLSRCTITEETITLPAGEMLPRPLYLAVSKVFESYGGQWRGGKVKHHKFPAGGTQKIREAMGTGEVKREKVIRQAFYTPSVVCDKLCAFASLHKVTYPRVLEPSCGNGAIIRAVRKHCPTARIVGYEIDAGAVEEARKNLSIQPAEGGAVLVHQSNFLEAKPRDIFDRVLMNPPFQNGQLAAHIAHAREFLAPGGVLVSVAPANFDMLHDISLKQGFAFTHDDLPSGSFKESGTGIETQMVRYERLK